MKWLLSFTLTFNFLLVFAQKPITKMKFDGEEFFMTNPPNGILLYDSVFIDKTEITNLHWLEYLHCIKKDSSYAFYNSQIIDSTYHYSGSFNKDYLHHPEFRNYPLIGVSYEQAKEYCKWRSDIVNTELKN